MDVKSTLLNGELEDEVYKEHLEWFQSTYDENQFYMLKKALYGLKKAPRGLYKKLDKHLKQRGLKRGLTNNNLYFKFDNDRFLIIAMYVDDIIFGINLEEMGHKFAKDMQKEFEMSMLGELTFFLGL